MADITMCDSKKCGVRFTCHRHEATPAPLQSWCSFDDEPPQANGGCSFYWPMKTEPHNQRDA